MEVAIKDITSKHTTRILLTSALIFSLVVGSGVKSKLVYLLAGDHYGIQVKSIRDALNSGFQIGLKQIDLIDLFEKHNEEENYILNNHVVCDFDLGCLNKTAFSRDLMTIYNKRYVEHFTPIYYLDDDRN